MTDPTGAQVPTLHEALTAALVALGDRYPVFHQSPTRHELGGETWYEHGELTKAILAHPDLAALSARLERCMGCWGQGIDHPRGTPHPYRSSLTPEPTPVERCAECGHETRWHMDGACGCEGDGVAGLCPCPTPEPK